MSNLFWKNKQEEKKQINRYESLGFERNPFPVDPCVKPGSEDDLENGKVYLNSLRTNEEKQFESLLVQKNGGQPAKKIALLMDYAAFRGRGIGKTAFLNHQLKRINDDYGYSISEGNETLFAVYVQPGGDKNERKFWQISKLIFQSIYEQDLLHVCLSRIRAFTGIISQDILNKITPENIKETILDNSWLEDKGVDTLDLLAKTKAELQRAGIDSEIVNCINYLAQGTDTFNRFFFATKSDSYWRNNENKLLYNDLVKLFRIAGFTAGIILFDESEKIVTVQNFQERRSFCDNLRYFYVDGASENAKSPFFRLLLTIHPYSQELLNPHWNAAGLNRFVELGGESAKHYTIFFNPLNSDSAGPLAALYINNSKRQKENDTGLDYTDIRPFQEEALQDILVKAEGIPGRYLQLLYLAIEMSIEEDWKSIGKKEIEQVIKTDIVKNISNDDNKPFSHTETNMLE